MNPRHFFKDVQMPSPGNQPSERAALYRNLTVAVVAVALATALSFPLREIFTHSRGLLLFVSIMFSAWYGGMKPGIVASILAAISFTVFFNDQHAMNFNLVGAARLFVYSAACITATYLMAQRNRALSTALVSNQQLERALEEIRVLRGILPICMHCKQIRDAEGSWQEVEQYIASQTDAKFSHGVCPDCMSKHYPEVQLTAR